MSYCSSVLPQVYSFNIGNGKQQTWFCCLQASSNLEKSTHHLAYSCLPPDNSEGQPLTEEWEDLLTAIEQQGKKLQNNV